MLLLQFVKSLGDREDNELRKARMTFKKLNLKLFLGHNEIDEP